MDCVRANDTQPAFSGLLIAADRGGGGKTLVSLGLARAYRNQGFFVKAFKKGPDYIDAAWLSHASGYQTGNLDPFFLAEEALRAHFYARMSKNATKQPMLALIEGNRGLYDGLDVNGSCSTAALARCLSIPVVLVINCTKITRTIAALVLGLTRFEPTTPFAGVVLNQVGTMRQGALLRTVLEQETDLPVLGILPRLATNPLPERHMGIASFGTHLALDREQRLEALARFVADNVDTQRLLTLASSMILPTPQRQRSPQKSAVTIGVVQDRAFWFYYPENLEELEAYGANLVPLSLTDPAASLPEELDGLYIGGGFPEDYAQLLSESPLRPQIAALARQGLPIYAECGGFMFLAKSLVYQGKQYPMANVFDVTVTFEHTPQGLGYTEGCITQANPFFPVGTRLRGHEFHYSRIQDPNHAFVMTLTKGHGMQKVAEHAFDGLTRHNVWASYTHIFAPAVPAWAPRFVELAKTYKSTKKF